MSDERMEKMVEGIGALDPEKDYTGSGLPRVEALEAVTGIADISGEDRDEAWRIYEATIESKTSDSPQESEDAPVSTDEGEPESETPEPEAGSIEPATEAPKGKCYVVAEGKSLTSRKGILGPGREVLPEYFGNKGAETIKNLADKGYIVEK